MIQLLMIQVHVGIRKLKIERVTSSARLDFVAAGEETLTEEEVTLEAVHCTFVRSFVLPFVDCGKHANTSFPVSIQDSTLDRQESREERRKLVHFL